MAKSFKSKQELLEALKPFKFTDNISMSKVMDIHFDIDKDYRGFSMASQWKRMYLLPFVIVFYTNETVIMEAFIRFFEKVRKHVIENSDKKVDNLPPRLIINKGQMLMDFFPNNNIRYKYHLYNMSKSNIYLDFDSIEELDFYQELEILKDPYTKFKTTKSI